MGRQKTLAPGNLRSVSNRALRDLLRDVIAQGFDVVQRGSLFVIRSPEGKAVSTHGTPSDYRAMKNLLRDLRKIGYTP